MFVDCHLSIHFYNEMVIKPFGYLAILLLVGAAAHSFTLFLITEHWIPTNNDEQIEMKNSFPTIWKSIEKSFSYNCCWRAQTGQAMIQILLKKTGEKSAIFDFIIVFVRFCFLFVHNPRSIGHCGGGENIYNKIFCECR